MTTAWTVVRLIVWGSIGFILLVFAPFGMALLGLGHVLRFASFAYRDALVWVLERLDRIARDASGVDR